ncbi:MAG: hypothetical protein Q4B50_00255 [Bacillota bacterium]|nr:hypothetical protein [Bacillota bacterium]
MRGFIRKNIKNYKFAHHSILSGQLLQDFQNQKNEILSESLTETPLISEEKPPKEQKKQVMPQKKEKKKVSFAKNFANDIIDIQSFKK